VEANEEEQNKKRMEDALKEVTIDDDAPDLEKHDELESKKK